MSLLEKLPTELLERVFQFCLNLDLPSASPVIAGKLSSVTVFNWTVMRVFGSSWDRGYGRERVVSDKSFEDGGDVRSGEGSSGQWGDENGELQSRVLKCRWASLEVLLRAKEAWIQRYAADRPFVPLRKFISASNPHQTTEFKAQALKLISTDFLKSMNPIRASTSPALITSENIDSLPTTPPPEQPPPPPSEPPEPRLTPSEFHDLDYASFLQFTSQPDGPSPYPYISWSPSPSSPYSMLPPETEIPHSLLTPPFTPQTLQHLFHLLKSGARISWLASTSGEVAFSGLKDAIRECNVEAVHLLVWSGLLERLDVEVLVWGLRNVGSGLETADENRKENGVVVSLEDKVKTINQILRLGFTAMDSRERGRAEAELLDMRDEALMRDDEEGLEFVRRVVESETLRGIVNVKV